MRHFRSASGLAWMVAMLVRRENRVLNIIGAHLASWDGVLHRCAATPRRSSGARNAAVQSRSWRTTRLPHAQRKLATRSARALLSWINHLRPHEAHPGWPYSWDSSSRPPSRFCSKVFLRCLQLCCFTNISICIERHQASGRRGVRLCTNGGTRISRGKPELNSRLLRKKYVLRCFKTYIRRYGTDLARVRPGLAWLCVHMGYPISPNRGHLLAAFVRSAATGGAERWAVERTGFSAPQ